ncbi:pantoate--beta-alanine ligase [Natronospora cellulosivora (SeqCode)]
MKIVKSINEIRNFVKEAKSSGKSIGFVPTMGFLHQGHLSLVEKAKEENDFVVVSIYVNPTQFSPDEDFEDYPRDMGSDSAKLEKLGVDCIFNPEHEEIYPEGFNTYITVNEITASLCGKSRPDHFKGVTTIVGKLFNIVQADKAYFGKKDYQQYLVIKKMVKELNFPLEVIGLPIVRESDGLAMSSRNKYLNQEERKQATVLNRSLIMAEELIKNDIKDVEKIKYDIIEMIEKESKAKIDYVEILDARNLKEIESIGENTLIALAVYIGKTRLIDNIVITLK